MNVVAYLSNTKIPITLREIVTTVPGYPETLQAARRTFERDKEELRAMNFDISLKETPNGDQGYIIVKDSTYFDIQLTPAQRNIVDYALKMYGPGKQTVSNAITKLGGMNPENDFTEVTSLPMPQIIDDIFNAISIGNTITIEFKDNKRNVLPRKLIAKSGYWYLEAYDLDKKESRTFRIDRISKITQDSMDVDENDYDSENREIGQDIEFVIRAHPALIDSFCKTWNGIYDKNKDEISFKLPRKELFLSKLYEYSGFVVVLKPEDLALDIEHSLDSIINKLESVS